MATNAGSREETRNSDEHCELFHVIDKKNHTKIERKETVEQKIDEKGKTLKDSTLEEMEHYWQESKNK